MIRNATILTVDPDRRVILDGTVVIDRDRIRDIGKTEDLDKKYRSAKTIEASEKLVMPGLINTHIHFYHHMHKGLSPENLDGWAWSNWVHGKIATILNAEDEIWGGLAVLVETLKSGTTTVLEAGSYNPEAVIEGVARIGMRMIIGRRVFDKVPPAASGQKSLVQDTDTCLKLNESFVKQYQNGLADGRVVPHVCIVGSGRCTDTLIVESKKMADRYGTLFNMHFARSAEEVQECVERTGRRPVENLHHLGALGKNVILVHMLQVGDSEMKLLQETGATAVFCPSTALKLTYGISKSGRFPEMLKAGVNVSLGTDAGDCANYQDMLRVMYLGAVLFKDLRMDPRVMGAETAIEMATIHGARALGMEKDIGSLEIGKKADIVVVDMTGADWIPRYNPIQNLIYSASGSSVETVIIDGKIVMEHREIKTVDEQTILRKCQDLSKEVLRRSGVTAIHTPWKVI
jgi:cytosine/adenosine deaminase-related metal-dependent hydrolase